MVQARQSFELDTSQSREVAIAMLWAYFVSHLDQIAHEVCLTMVIGTARKAAKAVNALEELSVNHS